MVNAVFSTRHLEDKKINHENTKSKKHEMFKANFRGFILSGFRDEKRTSNIQRPTSSFELFNDRQRLT